MAHFPTFRRDWLSGPRFPGAQELYAPAGKGRFRDEYDRTRLPVEVGTEELQKAGLAQEGVVQSGGNESDRGWPLEGLGAVADSQMDSRITANQRLGAPCKCDQALLGVRELNT